MKNLNYIQTNFNYNNAALKELPLDFRKSFSYIEKWLHEKQQNIEIKAYDIARSILDTIGDVQNSTNYLVERFEVDIEKDSDNLGFLIEVILYLNSNETFNLLLEYRANLKRNIEDDIEDMLELLN